MPPYDKDVPVKIVTLDNAVYIDRKDDIAFTIENHFVVLIEHQSTINFNMPVRMLMYLAKIYERMLGNKELYKRKGIILPIPELYVLYNGKNEMLTESEMKLSDNFYIENETDAYENSVEVIVKVINVKYNKKAEILKKCRELEEYSILIHYVEERLEQGEKIEKAARIAIEQCIKEGIMEEFLRMHGTEEVCGMLFESMSYEEFAELRAEEQYELGKNEGIEKGIELGRMLFGKLIYALICKILSINV